MPYRMPGGKALAGGVWGRCPLHLRGRRSRWTDDLGRDWQGMEVRSRSDVERAQVALTDVLVLAGVLGYPPDRHLVGFNQATDERGLSPFPTVPILSDLNSLMPDTLFIQQRSKLLCASNCGLLESNYLLDRAYRTAYLFSVWGL
jgi:hypothetical protein